MVEMVRNETLIRQAGFRGFGRERKGFGTE